MSFFDEMETLTPKKSRDLEGSCCLDEALNIKQMFRNYKQKKENAKVEAEKAKIENEKISKFTYDMEQSMTGNVDGNTIIKAIKEYETGNKRFALIRLSYAINFLGMAHPEDAEKAKSLVKSEIKRAREAGVEKSSILRELRLCKAAASKHTSFVNGLVDDITGKVSEAVELTLPGDGVKETTSEKQYVKVPAKQQVDYEAVQGKEVELEIPGDGVKETTSEKQYVKVPEKQEVDMESKLEESVSIILDDMDDIDELLDEAIELLSLDESKDPQRAVEKADKKVKKAERKLKLAKMAREELDGGEGGNREISFAKRGPATGLGTGMARNSKARSIARGKLRADDKIERAERKLEKAKAKADEARKAAGVSESMDFSVEEENLLIQLEESLEFFMDDMDEIDDLIDEAMEMAMFSEGKEERAKRKVEKAERKLKLAKMAREELDKGAGGNREISFAKHGPFTGLGTGMARNSKARSIARGKLRADDRIAKAERRLQKAKEKAGMCEAMELTLPGDGVKETTSGKDVYSKVANSQSVDAPEPKKDQAPEKLIKVGKADPSEVEEMAEDADEEEELMEESTVIEYFDEIKLSESQVRVFSQYGKYIISESDFEACCAYYDGESEETVLNAIAEANDIDANEIHIMLAEGRCAAKGKVKKAMNKKGSSAVDAERKRTEAKIRRLKDQLRDTAPSSATAKKLQAQIKKLKATLK